MIALKTPSESVDGPGEGSTFMPPTVSSETEKKLLKPEPHTVTWLPAGPTLGCNLMVGRRLGVQVWTTLKKVTVLSLLVEAVLTLPTASLAAPAAMEAITVPLEVMPLTATL
jgi:hypothetical protein